MVKKLLQNIMHEQNAYLAHSTFRIRWS